MRGAGVVLLVREVLRALHVVVDVHHLVGLDVDVDLLGLQDEWYQLRVVRGDGARGVRTASLESWLRSMLTRGGAMRGSLTGLSERDAPCDWELPSRLQESRALSETMSESEYSFVIVRLNTRCRVVS